jgi:hypothetical protein
MKLFVKNLIAFTIIMSSLASCQDNTSDEMESLQEEATVSQEEVLSALETVLIEYPIVALEKNASSTQLNDDFDLTTYAATNPKPEIVFPIDVLIDGTLVTINTKEEFKALVKERKGRKKPAFVFPISVILIDESNLEIADKDALKDYLDSLDEGIKPVFTFPLSIEKNGETIVVNNEEELKTFIGNPAK